MSVYLVPSILQESTRENLPGSNRVSVKDFSEVVSRIFVSPVYKIQKDLPCRLIMSARLHFTYGRLRSLIQRQGK